MSPRPDLGFWPRLGYAESRIDRAAHLRLDAEGLRALETDAGAGFYVVGGDLIAMHKTTSGLDAMFSRSDAHAVGTIVETIFLGLADGVPRFAIAIYRAAIESGILNNVANE